MKKRDLSRMALVGVASGLMLLCQTAAAAANSKSTEQSTSPEKSPGKESNDGNLGYHLYTEDELLLELNDQGTAMYKSLDAQGKVLARYVASQRCDHTNKCRGLNACQTDKNPCAGKGSCEGTGKCAVSDKNLAVKLVYDKMAKKRAQANQRTE